MCFLCVFYISLFDTLCLCPPRLIILLNKISDRDCSNLQIAFLFTNFLMSEQTDFLPGIDYRWLFSSTTLQLVCNDIQMQSNVLHHLIFQPKKGGSTKHERSHMTSLFPVFLFFWFVLIKLGTGRSIRTIFCDHFLILN